MAIFKIEATRETHAIVFVKARSHKHAKVILAHRGIEEGEIRPIDNYFKMNKVKKLSKEEIAEYKKEIQNKLI